MKSVSTFLIFFISTVAFAQLDIYAKPRLTGYAQPFGEQYSGAGYDLGFSSKTYEKRLMFGAQFTHLALNEVEYFLNASSGIRYYDSKSDMLSFHAGYKGNIFKFFYPYASVVAGLQYFEFDDTYGRLSVTYGLRTGFQVGTRKWRGDLSLEVLRSTPTKYLSANSFQRAFTEGGQVRSYAERGVPHSLSIAIGVVRVIHWRGDAGW